MCSAEEGVSGGEGDYQISTVLVIDIVYRAPNYVCRISVRVFASAQALVWGRLLIDGMSVRDNVWACCDGLC